jgi:hypothetical protein
VKFVQPSQRARGTNYYVILSLVNKSLEAISDDIFESVETVAFHEIVVKFAANQGATF